MEKMVPNLHINSVLPHHSCESTRSSKVRKTEHRPNNFMKNGPEKPINASSGTRWTDIRQACPKRAVVPGQKAQGSAPGRTGTCSGEGPESRGEQGLPLLLMETSSGCGNPSRGEGKKKTHSEESSLVEIQRWLVGGVKLAQEHRSPLRVRREPES